MEFNHNTCDQIGDASVMPLDIDRICAERDATYCKIGELNDKFAVLSDTIGHMKEKVVALNQNRILLRNDNAKLNQEKTVVGNLFEYNRGDGGGHVQVTVQPPVTCTRS